MTRVERAEKKLREVFEKAVIEKCLVVWFNNIPLYFYDWKACLKHIKKLKKANIPYNLERGTTALFKDIYYVGYRSK